ncbi:helical backbone metal receptor [Pedobacter sp. JY14-1]|uniref:ABC transporter substrate-binding protein n=1 Tax=Pedobacter sp. JY14-1 TaxID=3034151 RepID=UPI0023E213D3|nr:helical backbone metal receptor [Pedobacter sp. JY14-1]
MQRSFTDQLGRTMQFSFPPKRIVSVVPSQTELLFELGLDNEVVGLTRSCIHPIAKFAARVKVGDPKMLDLAKIRSLQPDLILAGKEENRRGELSQLADEFPVWTSDVATLEHAMTMIASVGSIVDREPEASYLNHLLQAGFSDLQSLAAQQKIDKKVIYLVGNYPYIAAGRDTFISDLLVRNGLRNVAGKHRYIHLDITTIRETDPDIVMLASIPYPFRQEHLEELQRQLPGVQVMLVDGELFSWYGSGLIKSVQYLFQLQQKLRS